MACLYYENISLSPILGLPCPELPEWANGGPILVFMMLEPFSLISTQENRSNDMLHAYIMKHLILRLPNGPQGGSVLPKWANRDLILVFMILGHFSLISSHENGSNGMLHAYITKNVNFINSGQVGNGPLGGDHRKKNCPPFMMWQKLVFDYTISVLFRNNKKFHMDSMSRSVGVVAGL